MKINSNPKFLAATLGVALMFLQLMGNIAFADYRGYWADAVNHYQTQRPNYQPQYEPTPQYANYDYGYAPQADIGSAPRYVDYTPTVRHPAMNVGKASYYGDQYHGRPTASGERYDRYSMTAAHRDLPFGTPIRVTNLQNGHSVIVRVNDRGPFKPGRVVDVSMAAAEQLGLLHSGSAEVQVDVLG